MPVTVRNFSTFQATHLGNNWAIPGVPGVQDGDLLIFTIQAKQIFQDFQSSAWIRAPAGWTDLMRPVEDGAIRDTLYTPNYQIRISDIVSPIDLPARWWIGWKIANSEPLNYNISTEGPLFFGFHGTSFGIVASVLALYDFPPGPAFQNYAFVEETFSSGTHQNIDIPQAFPNTEQITGSSLSGWSIAGALRLVFQEGAGLMSTIVQMATWLGGLTYSFIPAYSTIYSISQPGVPQNGHGWGGPETQRISTGVHAQTEEISLPMQNTHLQREG